MGHRRPPYSSAAFASAGLRRAPSRGLGLRLLGRARPRLDGLGGLLGGCLGLLRIGGGAGGLGADRLDLDLRAGAPGSRCGGDSRCGACACRSTIFSPSTCAATRAVTRCPFSSSRRAASRRRRRRSSTSGWNVAPSSCGSRSTSSHSPSRTRCCFPPTLMIAYAIVVPKRERAGTGPARPTDSSSRQRSPVTGSATDALCPRRRRRGAVVRRRALDRVPAPAAAAACPRAPACGAAAGSPSAVSLACRPRHRGRRRLEASGASVAPASGDRLAAPAAAARAAPRSLLRCAAPSGDGSPASPSGESADAVRRSQPRLAGLLRRRLGPGRVGGRAAAAPASSGPRRPGCPRRVFFFGGAGSAVGRRLPTASARPPLRPRRRALRPAALRLRRLQPPRDARARSPPAARSALAGFFRPRPPRVPRRVLFFGGASCLRLAACSGSASSLARLGLDCCSRRRLGLAAAGFLRARPRPPASRRFGFAGRGASASLLLGERRPASTGASVSSRRRPTA